MSEAPKFENAPVPSPEKKNNTPVPQAKENIEKPVDAKIITIASPEDLQKHLPAILNIEKACYPKTMVDGEGKVSPQKYKEWLQKNGPMRLLEVNGNVIGYTAGVRGSRLPHLGELNPEELKGGGFFGNDKENKEYYREDVLYLWDVAISGGARERGLYATTLFPNTVRDAARQGYKKIVYHARQGESYGPILKQHGANVVRVVKDWFPEEKDAVHDLMELDLTDPKNEKLQKLLR